MFYCVYHYAQLIEQFNRSGAQQFYCPRCERVLEDGAISSNRFQYEKRRKEELAQLQRWNDNARRFNEERGNDSSRG